MIRRLRRQEPSFNSMKEKSFESRRVRTQPCTKIRAIGAELFSASFTEIGESVSLTISIRKPGTQEKQLEETRPLAKQRFHPGPRCKQIEIHVSPQCRIVLEAANAKSAHTRESSISIADLGSSISRDSFSAIGYRQSGRPARQSRMVERAFRQKSAGWNSAAHGPGDHDP